MRVAIVGLGLIGGSLGLCLKTNKLISSVFGLDLLPAHEKQALDLGLIHELIAFEDLPKCELIFIATPVDEIIKVFSRLATLNLPPSTTLIELGSTKGRIIQTLPPSLREQTLFAHPMTGTEHSGPGAAFAGLYPGGVCVLCDAEGTGEAHRRRGVEVFSHIGMKISFMDSQAHDYHVAIISHLPHAISFSLANFVMKEEDKKTIATLAGGSFTGMSRIAKSSPAMWGSIFSQNKANLLGAITHFQAELERCKKMIQAGEDEALRQWMSQANALREIL